MCEASGLWGVLARACSVRVHRLEGIQAPFPAVAEGVRVHLHLRLRSREGLGTLMLPVCLERNKVTTYYFSRIVHMLWTSAEKRILLVMKTEN